MVFEDADLPRALDAALFIIFSINGERCTAGSRILVQTAIYADSSPASSSARGGCVGDPLDEKTIIGPMITPPTWTRCTATSSSAEGGGDAACGGLDRPS